VHDPNTISSAFRGEFTSRRRGKQRFDDDEPITAKRVRGRRGLAPIETFDATDGLPEGDRWSTWDQSIPTQRGPRPHPGWLVTELAAVDTELGILKTGKEADVFLIRRAVPEGRSCLLAAKRYRDAGHRMFHRDSGYLEGRRTRESRGVNRAVAARSTFGRQAIAGQWAHAEFSALARLYAAGSAYNLLVHDGRLVMIDLPQVVDVIADPPCSAARPCSTPNRKIPDPALCGEAGGRFPVDMVAATYPIE
jgi:hypothetical protein